MSSGCLQGRGMIGDLRALPAGDRAIEDALVLIDQALEVGLMDGTQPRAGGASSIGFIEGEVRHADLWNRRAAMGAGKSFLWRGIVVCARLALPFRVGGVEGGGNVVSTGRAGTVPQAGKQHAQIGIDFGGRANGGTRAV